VVLVAVVAVQFSEAAVVTIVEEVPASRAFGDGRIAEPDLEVRSVGGVEDLEPQDPGAVGQPDDRGRAGGSRARA
jgi:hypothetical protein